MSKSSQTIDPVEIVTSGPFGGVGDPASLYTKTLRKSEEEETRFDLYDVFARAARCVVAFYWTMLRYPVSFFVFLLRYNMLWEGTPVGFALTVCFYPVLPFAVLALVVAKKVLGMNGGYVPAKGNIFFEPPKSPLAALLWDYYKALSPPFAQFMLNRGDTKAIAHSWYDHETHKDFWRAHLERVGARVPLEIGRWKLLESGAWGVEWASADKMQGRGLVIKVTDESNGIGDAFLLFGEGGEGYVNGPEALEEFLESDPVYAGKEALVLEWIRPASGQEVHTLDIVTVALPNGAVEVLTVLYWGECEDGKTSHSTRAGYVVDAANEQITASCSWYAPGFAAMTPKPQFSIGHKLPGVAKACQLMVEAHRSAMIEQPWLKMIGWDAMLAHGGPPVFFEGNYAQMRLPRRVFLSWENLWHCLTQWC